MTSNFIFKKYHTVKETLASLVAQIVKNLPTMQETWVKSLGQGDLLEKEMATHSRILAWRITGTEEPCRLQSMGWQRLRQNRLIHFLWIWRYVSIHVIPKFYEFENMNRFMQFPSELIHNIVPFPQKRWAPTPILKNQNTAF